MRFTYKIATLICLALSVISCAEDTSEKKEQYDELFHQVLDVHDEVMPKMGDVAQLSSEIKAIADTSASAEKYLQAEQRLQQADIAMMDWMHSFSDEFVKNKAQIQKMNNEQLQEKIDALQEELIEVKAMQEKVNSSIENARNLTE